MKKILLFICLFASCKVHSQTTFAVINNEHKEPGGLVDPDEPNVLESAVVPVKVTPVVLVRKHKKKYQPKRKYKKK